MYHVFALSCFITVCASYLPYTSTYTTHNIQVVNFYDLRNYAHIKTVPVMEELEGVILLNEAHSALLLGSAASKSKGVRQHVLVTAGAAGVLKFFKVSMAGSAESFEISALLHFPLSSAARYGIADTAVTSRNTAEAESLSGVSSLHYLPLTGEVLSVTKDYNLCAYSIAAFVQQLAKGSNERLEPSKLLIGSQGEILDMALIPNSSDASGSGFKLALVTNSTQVRIINERFSCSLLEGHKDIVLCVDVSPDG